ncbi:sulfatase-like hydrolase/transferase [Galbibacter sp. PAP.153]|uniref:sulfatase-like hydrolase/transferase n=1 Tax=Galbibacter sp. PAP.153 TaxID=3104623 RepID=UPI00300B8239
MKYLFFTVLTCLFIGCKEKKQVSENFSKPDPKPNIIFILTDDLGYGDIGVLFQNQRKKEGKPHFKTPFIDEMANSGITLARHYVPAPVCAPSRASLLYGVHQGHSNIRNNQFDKALSDVPNMASMLKEAGYATALVGKWGLQGLTGNSPDTWKAFPTKRGFDYFFGYVRHVDGHNHYPAHKAHDRPKVELYENNDEISGKLEGCYTTDLFTAAAKHWIYNQAKSKSRPFFLELAFDTPHAGLQIAPSPYPEGGGVNGGIQWKGTPGRFINTADTTIDDYYHPDYAKKDWPDPQKRFASMVRRIDNAIGDIRQLLKDLSIDRETLIVFTSDNGPHNESYGYGKYDPTFFDSFANLDGIKRDTWEGGIRVPTFVSWPGHIPDGIKNNQPSAFYDWMPTFAEIAGIAPPARTDGVSLWPILNGEKETNDGMVYIEYSQNGKTPEYSEFEKRHQGAKRGEMQVVYLEGYKGIRQNIQSQDDDFQIYNIQEDAEETKDLASSSPYFEALQTRMKSKVLQSRRPDHEAKRPYDGIIVPSVKLKNIKKGIQYTSYKKTTSWIPDVRVIKNQQLANGVQKALNITNIVKGDSMVVSYKGYLHAPTSGEYTFSLQADSNSILRIHNAKVIDMEDREAPLEAKIMLEKGYHPLNLIYAHNKGEPSLSLKSKGPNDIVFKEMDFSY